MKFRYLVLSLLLTLYGMACAGEIDGPWSPRGRHARLVLEFSSDCCGTNRAAEKALEALLDEYRNERHVALEFNGFHWGLEGEHTYCFWLNELDLSGQAEFVRRVRESVVEPVGAPVDAPMVTIREASRCKCESGEPGGFATFDCQP